MNPWPSKKLSCRIVSWNGAAVFQDDPVKANQKIAILAKLALVYDIILIQEAYGDENDLRARFPQASGL